MTHPVLPPDRGPLGAIGLISAAGVAATGFGVTALGTVLVLIGLAGAVAFAVGPVLTRRSTRIDDIVVPQWVGPDATALAADQRRLLNTLGSAEQVRTVIRPRLAALVEARLRARGVEPDSDEARSLQGASLTAFLDGDAVGAMSARGLGSLLDRVEAL